MSEPSSLSARPGPGQGRLSFVASTRVIVVHAVWSSAHRALALWAEDSQELRQVSAGTKRSWQQNAHPYALTNHLQILRACGLDTSFGGTRSGQIQLRLPSSARSPLPSPELSAALNRPMALAGVQPWTVAAALLDPGAAATALGMFKDTPSVRMGKTVYCFAHLVRVAKDLVGAGLVLPAISEPEGGLLGNKRHAQWLAEPTPSVKAYTAKMALTLPHLARSENTEGKPPTAQTVIEEFLDGVVDGFCRRRLQALDWKRETASLPTGPASTWVKALGRSDAKLPFSAKYEELAQSIDVWKQEPDIPYTTRLRLRLHPPQTNPALAALVEEAQEQELVDNKDLENSWWIDATLIDEESENELYAYQLATDSESVEDFSDILGTDADGVLRNLLKEATTVFEPLQPLAQAPAAGGVDLALDDIAALVEAIEPLSDKRCEVIIPEQLQTPAQMSAKLSLKSAQTQTSSGMLGLDNIVHYEWEIEVDGEVFDLSDLFAAAEHDLPTLKTKKGWVRLSREELSKLLDFFRKNAQSDSVDAMTALKLAAGADAPEIAGALSVQLRGWIEDFVASDSEQRLELMKTPKDMAIKLYDYQEEGLSWLWFLDRLGFGPCLADGMGVGKTAQTIALLLAEREADENTSASLLIAPMSVVSNWAEELQLFAPTLKVHIHHGADRFDSDEDVKLQDGDKLAAAAQNADVILTTYGLAIRDLDALRSHQWHRVIIDEAQNIKNFDSQQTKAINQIPALRRLALTGTPIENRLAELFSIFNWLNPGLLGTWSQFQERFVASIEKRRDETVATTLKDLIEPFILRRLKTDPRVKANLPDKIEQIAPIPLTAEQVKLYEQIVEEGLAQIASASPMRRRALILQLISRLKQVCNHPRQITKEGEFEGRSGKVAYIEEKLQEIVANGEKALIFTQYVEELGQPLSEYLAQKTGKTVLFFHGSLSAKKRKAMRIQFAEDPDAVCLVVSLKAGGTGLNLVAANHVFHFDRWWNPAVEDQATDRAYRGGQVKDVIVTKLVCHGTFEDRINELIESKRELADMIVGGPTTEAGVGAFTEMSTTELRKALSLSHEALVEQWDVEEIPA